MRHWGHSAYYCVVFLDRVTAGVLDDWSCFYNDRVNGDESLERLKEAESFVKHDWNGMVRRGLS